MNRDRIYAAPRKPIKPFEFNSEVVGVFDDMILRSVPGYREIICRQAEMAGRFYQEGTRVYDLGCSTGNFGHAFSDYMEDRDFSLVSVDSSEPMIKACRNRITSDGTDSRFDFVCSFIETVKLSNASVIVLNFTLQFIPVEKRFDILRDISSALVPGGILLFSEKTTHSDPMVASFQQETYYRFKADNGYSELEISQKREALENILIPETPQAHLKRLHNAGFGSVDIWYKWFNFMSLFCHKQL